jgi:hypothetical protein
MGSVISDQYFGEQDCTSDADKSAFDALDSSS